MTLDLSREAFVDLATEADGPVVIRVAAPLPQGTTPVAAYAALAGRTTDIDRAPYAFLLESAEKVASSDPDGAFAPDTARDRHARYSFVGYDPDAVVTVDPDGATVEPLRETAAAEMVTPASGDTLDTLRGALPDVELAGFPDTDRQQLAGGLVGFLAYDAVYDLWLEEVGVDHPGTDKTTPDAGFVLNTKTITFDHARDAVSLVFTPVLRSDDDPDACYDRLQAEADRVETLLTEAEPPDPGGFVRTGATAGPKDAYEAAVRTTKERILDGETYQTVISRKRVLEGEIDPLGLYAALRDINPSPYMYLLGFDDLSVVGASPETLISVRGREIVGNPIAGTCARGTSPVEDRRLAGEMLADDKERAEHTMLVDLARNDLRRVAEPGTVRVEEFMNVLKYSHVQHIESTVTGRLAEAYDAFDATRAAFPAGTLSGAPKIRSMEIIDELEREPRGLYGGGVGYYSWTGDADFAIVIRTATIDHGEPDRVTVQAGAGLVADSVPEHEYEETEKKMGGVIDAIERIETDPVEDPEPATEPEVTD
ncbi:MAG: anthranilate synthase component I [Halobacteriales archaeon]